MKYKLVIAEAIVEIVAKEAVDGLLFPISILPDSAS